MPFFKKRKKGSKISVKSKGNQDGTFLVLRAGVDGSSTAQHHGVLETFLTSWQKKNEFTASVSYIFQLEKIWCQLTL